MDVNSFFDAHTIRKTNSSTTTSWTSSGTKSVTGQFWYEAQ